MPKSCACLSECISCYVGLIPKSSVISGIFVYYCNCNGAGCCSLISLISVLAVSFNSAAKFHLLVDCKPSTGCSVSVYLQLIQFLTRIRFISSSKKCRKCKMCLAASV
jgi:hypothetical protein